LLNDKTVLIQDTLLLIKIYLQSKKGTKKEAKKLPLSCEKRGGISVIAEPLVIYR